MGRLILGILILIIFILSFNSSSISKNSNGEALTDHLYLRNLGPEILKQLEENNFSYEDLATGLKIKGTVKDYERTFGIPIQFEDGKISYPPKSEPISLNFMSDENPYEPLVDYADQGLSPDVLKRAYGIDRLHSEGYKGEGIRIAIVVAYGSPTITDDLRQFSIQFGLPEANLEIIYPNGNPNVENEKWALTTNLVLEWIHAIAPLATKYLIVAKDSGSSLEDAMVYSFTKDYDIIVFPFGKNESSMDRGVMNYLSYNIRNIANKGTVVIAPVDDSGNNLILYPSSDPYVLSVGGTMLYLDNNGYYAYEKSWDKSFGSKSEVFKRPPWQEVIGLGENDGRAFPDVSMAASNGFKIFFRGSLINLKGNAAAASHFASLLALSFQIANKRFENLARMLYEIYSSSFYSGLFNDIKLGERTAEGWDYATGIGSTKAYNLAHFIAKEFLTLSINYSGASYPPYFLIDNQAYPTPIKLNLMRNFTHRLEAQEYLYESGLKRYAFKAWNGSLESNQRVLFIPIVKNYELTIEYKVQYNVIVNSNYSIVTGAGWYDQGSIITISLDNTISYISNYTRAIFLGWEGIGLNSYSGTSKNFSLRVDSWVIENAIWKIQHFVQVISDFFGNSSGWYDEKSRFNFTIEDPYYVSDEERYIVKKWLVLLNNTNAFYLEGNGISLEVNAPMTIKPIFIRQFKLSFSSNIPLEKLKGSLWYDENSIAHFYTELFLYETSNRTRYVFLSLSLDGETLNTNELYIKMDRPHHIETNYKVQHYISVQSPFYTIFGAGWYDQGSIVTISLSYTEYYINNSTRYYFKNFNVSEYLDFKRSDIAMLKIKVEKPLHIVANWVLQYYVYLHNRYGNAIGSGWYDAGSIAAISVEPSYMPLSEKSRLAFTHWLIDDQEYYGAFVIVDKPLRAEAVYSLQYLVNIDLRNMKDERIAGNIILEFLDPRLRVYYFNNTSVWLIGNVYWKLNKVILEGRSFKVENVSFFVNSPLDLKVKLNIIDLEIFVRSLFGLPIKDFEIEVNASNYVFRVSTDAEGRALVKYVDPGQTKLRYKTILGYVEEGIGESDNKVITIFSFYPDFFVFLLIALLGFMLFLVRKLQKWI